MPLPKINNSITDPGLGSSVATARNTLYMGVSSAGTVDTLKSFSVPQDVVDYFGQGPLSEGMCRHLEIAGGPVYGMRLTGTTVGASGSVTKTSADASTGTIAVSTPTAYDSYRVIIEITKDGAIGAGEFRYSLDYSTDKIPNGGQTFSGSIVIPAGGVYTIPDTGLAITFTDGIGPEFEVGDSHRFDSTAPLYTVTDLASGFTALALTETPLSVIALEGEHATASAAATMFGTLSTKLTAMETEHKFVGGFMDGGSLEDNRATAITAHAASENTRIAIGYGYATLPSSKPIAGWGTIRRSYVGLAASRAGAVKESTDLARKASGAITGVVAIRDNEQLSPVMQDSRFLTMRTWPGEVGSYYISDAWLRSGSGSDFLYWQHRAIMDLANRIVIETQQPFISEGVVTNPDGTIDEAEAVRFEGIVKSALRAALIDTTRENGKKGQVSDLGYSIDRENDLLGTGTMNTTTKIRPLGYIKTLNSNIGFTRAV